MLWWREVGFLIGDPVMTTSTLLKVRRGLWLPIAFWIFFSLYSGWIRVVLLLVL